jgi:hypothetical protein
LKLETANSTGCQGRRFGAEKTGKQGNDDICCVCVAYSLTFMPHPQCGKVTGGVDNFWRLINSQNIQKIFLHLDKKNLAIAL